MVMRTMKNLRCCITGTYLSQDDNVVCFPMFLDEPQNAKEQIARYLADPSFRSIYDCNEGYALRSAFATWKLRETVLAKAKESFIQQAHDPPYRTILWQDDDYLLQRIHIENRIVAYFLNHLVTIDCPQEVWLTFCEEIREKEDRVFLQTSQHVIDFDRRRNSVLIVKKWVNVNFQNWPYESIELSKTEWQTFESIICRQIDNLL